MMRQGDTLVGYRALTETPPVGSPPKKARGPNGKAIRSVINHYLKMNKVLVGPSGAAQLVSMADRLEEKGASSSNALSIKGWMLAEASLAGHLAFSWDERADLLDRAEAAFSEAAEPIDENRRFTDNRYRIALAMSHVPLIRAVVDGNVTNDIQESVTQDVLEITNTIPENNNPDRLYGLAHELSMMGLIHMMKDSRYVTIPSTYRGGNGTYHKSQTHDLTLIKQHFGHIRQVQPIEVKGHVVDRHRQRYWSTLLSSEELISNLSVDPMVFNRSMLEVFNGNASEAQFEAVQVAMSSLVASLKTYRMTGKPKRHSMNTPTRFYGRNQFMIA